MKERDIIAIEMALTGEADEMSVWQPGQAEESVMINRVAAGVLHSIARRLHDLLEVDK